MVILYKVKISECDHCAPNSALRDIIKCHKYVKHDGLGHGCVQCYNKSTKLVKYKPYEVYAWEYEV